MKLTKIVAILAFMAGLGFALQYIASPENSIALKTDWGIANDNPIRNMRR